MQRGIGPFLTSVCFGLTLALSPASAGAATRGISVELRASEAPGAPVSETVRLYEKSYALVIKTELEVTLTLFKGSVSDQIGTNTDEFQLLERVRGEVVLTRRPGVRNWSSIGPSTASPVSGSSGT